MRTFQAMSVRAVLAVAMATIVAGCAVYGPRSYGRAAYGSNYECGYGTVYRCGYYGTYGGSFSYGYSHLHYGWNDGFHGGFGSSYSARGPWFSHDFAHGSLGYGHDYTHSGRDYWHGHAGTSWHGYSPPIGHGLSGVHGGRPSHAAGSGTRSYASPSGAGHHAGHH